MKLLFAPSQDGRRRRGRKHEAAGVITAGFHLPLSSLVKVLSLLGAIAQRLGGFWCWVIACQCR